MKIIENFNFRYGLFFNRTALQILATSMAVCVSMLLGVESFFSVIIVISMLIFFKLISSNRKIEIKSFAYELDLLGQRHVAMALQLFLFIAIIVKVVLAINLVSIFQYLYVNDTFDLDTLKAQQDQHSFSMNTWIIVAPIVLFFTDMALLFISTMANPSIKGEKEKIIKDYALDESRTAFIIIDKKLVGFTVGKHKFHLKHGLQVGKRCYSPSIVLDYLNIVDIGFKDLDEGHIKNIEMYGIGS